MLSFVTVPAEEENKAGLEAASSTVMKVEENMSNPSTSASSQNPIPAKRRRSLPGNPDPEAEVIALSPNTLMATNRFVCEICNKGFQRDQNLQLHRRGHNLPWKLKQRTNKEARKKVYVCPDASCVHHHPSRALGDLTGIKKHFSRKHGEKKWKCEKCSKKYAVHSDWKAHSKICGTREYRCNCGTLFSRAFCDALAEESVTVTQANPVADHHQHLYSQPLSSHELAAGQSTTMQPQFPDVLRSQYADIRTSHGPYVTMKQEVSSPWAARQGPEPPPAASTSQSQMDPLSFIYSTTMLESEFQLEGQSSLPASYQTSTDSPYLSSTALLREEAQMGAMTASPRHIGQMAAHTSSATGFSLGWCSDGAPLHGVKTHSALLHEMACPPPPPADIAESSEGKPQ
ncbi:hypothetical protein B296_00042027 [Ensete ventricosum]|uniref:C2H2-type domain-containing protein n=1 Tax=Ensete ventricosum TaxID=4639 RepID=A0A426ZJQ3_ENSVE|nr:hypothetical protein B296_00042027 [Ensete ventricosum]